MECPDVYIVERLFSSSLVVVVSLSMPRRMNVYHFKKGTEICNYSYSNNILAVKLNRQVIFQAEVKSKGPFHFIACNPHIFVPVAAAGGVPGRVHLHPQHQRYEAAQDLAQHPHKPLRYTELFAVLSNQAWIEVAEGPQDTLSVCQAAKLQKSLQSALTHKLQILAF